LAHTTLRQSKIDENVPAGDDRVDPIAQKLAIALNAPVLQFDKTGMNQRSMARQINCCLDFVHKRALRGKT
jgi:hypothetical protein